MQDVDDGLGPDFRDHLVTTGKAVASLVPLVGGALGELLGHLVPKQRTDRLTSYVRSVEQRLVEVEMAYSAIITDPNKVDLIEEGAFQAARATSADRIEMIASLVVYGLSAEDVEVVRRKRLGGLLAELDDDEIIILNAYAHAFTEQHHRAWDRVDEPPHPTMQSGQLAIERRKLFEAGREHLVRLGLLRKELKISTSTGMPEYDRGDRDFKHRIEVAPLGRILLRSIGLMDDKAD